MPNCSSMGVSFLPSSLYPSRLHHLKHHSTSNTSIIQKKTETDQQCLSQHGGGLFGLQTPAVVLCCQPSTSLRLSKKTQKDHMSSDFYKRELGLHYLVELVTKSTISTHPRAPKHSTYQSLANCLLLRSKNRLCVFVTPQMMRRRPRGKGNVFQARSFECQKAGKQSSSCFTCWVQHFLHANVVEGASY